MELEEPLAKSRVFEANAPRYERWFEKHAAVYEAELRAVEGLIPKGAKGVSIGVGTGRFAEPLGVRFGVDPSSAMAAVAVKRGVRVVRGVAECLPLRFGVFDFALMITTICFVDDAARAVSEAVRILVPGGSLLVGIVDLESPLGRYYEAHRKESVFYGEATFFSTREVIDLMQQAGLDRIECAQTLFRPVDRIDADEPVKNGYGKGAFVVIRGRKQGRRGHSGVNDV